MSWLITTGVIIATTAWFFGLLFMVSKGLWFIPYIVGSFFIAMYFVHKEEIKDKQICLDKGGEYLSFGRGMICVKPVTVINIR